MIIAIDRNSEKISLGLKQLSQNPWGQVEQKFSIGSQVRGKVVNILQYGAFVELQPGIEGLVHISEISWTKRITRLRQAASAMPSTRRSRGPCTACRRGSNIAYFYPPHRITVIRTASPPYWNCWTHNASVAA